MSGRTVKATLVGINRDYGENDFRSVVLCCLGRGISRQNPHKDCRNSDGAAAVVIMSARLAGVPASELIRRVTIPLLIGGLVLIAAAMAWSY